MFSEYGLRFFIEYSIIVLVEPCKKVFFAQVLGGNMKLILFALSFFLYLPSLHAFKITNDQDIRHLLMTDSGFSKTIQAETLLRGWGRVRIKSVSCDHQKARKCLKEDFERNGIPESAAKGNKWFCSMKNYKVEFVADGYDKIRKMSFSLIFPDTVPDSGFSCASVYKKIKAGPYPVNFKYKKESMDNF